MNPSDPNANPDALRVVTLTLCARCVEGVGGECHTPGCALWMNRAPDIPIAQAAETAPCPDSTRDADEPLTVTLRRGQWAVVLGAASSYDVRVPLEQGDGGACLDAIRDAMSSARPA